MGLGSHFFAWRVACCFQCGWGLTKFAFLRVWHGWWDHNVTDRCGSVGVNWQRLTVKTRQKVSYAQFFHLELHVRFIGQSHSVVVFHLVPQTLQFFSCQTLAFLQFLERHQDKIIANYHISRLVPACGWIEREKERGKRESQAEVGGGGEKQKETTALISIHATLPSIVNVQAGHKWYFCRISVNDDNGNDGNNDNGTRCDRSASWSSAA